MALGSYCGRHGVEAQQAVELSKHEKGLIPWSLKTLSLARKKKRKTKKQNKMNQQ
jgi:hypothetical protein